jgi:hypothetical protein
MEQRRRFVVGDCFVVALLAMTAYLSSMTFVALLAMTAYLSSMTFFASLAMTALCASSQ